MFNRTIQVPPPNLIRDVVVVVSVVSVVVVVVVVVSVVASVDNIPPEEANFNPLRGASN